MAYKSVCSDILQFQEQLKQMRDLNDKVIYSLNNSLPTPSIKARTGATPEGSCKGLFDTLQDSYIQREKVIQDCIILTAQEVGRLKKEKESSDDIHIEKLFKSEQRKLRVLKTEQTVEMIVREKTLKAFNERCRPYYRADSF